MKIYQCFPDSELLCCEFWIKHWSVSYADLGSNLIPLRYGWSYPAGITLIKWLSNSKVPTSDIEIKHYRWNSWDQDYRYSTIK